MVRVDEKVSVAVNDTGEPIGFSWRNNSYLVNAKPTRWFARREWWVEAARVQRGIGAGVLELEMWRLLASCVDKEKPRCQYELLHSALDNEWKLVRIFD
jgi:hypothetical protein